jgi:hypothetical protein
MHHYNYYQLPEYTSIIIINKIIHVKNVVLVTVNCTEKSIQIELIDVSSN